MENLTADSSPAYSRTSGNQLSEDDLVSLMVAWVRRNSQVENIETTGLTPDTDLIASGILNSFGFIDLLLFLEDRLACTIDLENIEPSDFSVIRRLCRLALQSRKSA